MKRETCLEVNLNNFENNLINVQKHVAPKEVLPVIKADAYGMGVKAILNMLDKNNVKTSCVALVLEGIDLRNYGYTKNILIINPCLISEIEDVVKYDLTLGVSIKEIVIELNKIAEQNNKVMNIHLEIETGMYRTGIRLEKLQEFIDMCKSFKNINIDGIYTHFATSDEKDSEYMKQQISIFEKAVKLLKDNGIKPTYIHMSNSGGVQQVHDDDFTTAVRPGLILYGHNVNEEFEKLIDIKPVSILVSSVSLVKQVKDEDVELFGAEKIATVPIGYADGYPRSLSRKGKVIINNKICNLVGNVMMDNILVDVTDLDNVKIGDKVYLWDNDKITVEELAENAGTINYEILSRISPRVERRYV